MSELGSRWRRYNAGAGGPRLRHGDGADPLLPEVVDAGTATGRSVVGTDRYLDA